jgi:hypothetical protein
MSILDFFSHSSFPCFGISFSAGTVDADAQSTTQSIDSLNPAPVDLRLDVPYAITPPPYPLLFLPAPRHHVSHHGAIYPRGTGILQGFSCFYMRPLIHCSWLPLDPSFSKQVFKVKPEKMGYSTPPHVWVQVDAIRFPFDKNFEDADGYPTRPPKEARLSMGILDVIIDQFDHRHFDWDYGPAVLDGEYLRPWVTHVIIPDPV